MGIIVGAILKFRFFTLLIALLAGSFAFSQQLERPLFLSFEQRLALSYTLLGAGETEEKYKQAVERMLLESQRATLTNVVVEVSSFDEFLREFRGQWPDSHSLEKDLEIIERQPSIGQRQFKATTPELQVEIDEYLTWQKQQLQNHVAGSMRIGSIIPSELFTINDLVRNGFHEAGLLVHSEFQKISNLGSTLLQVGSGQQDTFQTFISLAVGGYFKNLNLKSKKQILNQIFGLPLNATPVDKFEVMVMNSGPQFQKLLQIIARESNLSPQMQVVFRRLESRVRPVPAVLVKEIIEREMRNYSFESYNPEPFGVGTMAQVHKGSVRTAQGLKNVVIRFLKPEIAERVEEDRLILARIAPVIDANEELVRSGFPKVTTMVDDLSKTISDELNIQETVARQIQGASAYNRTVSLPQSRRQLVISVPTIIPSSSGQSDLMVQEYVPGRNFDEFQPLLKSEFATIKREVVRELALVWLNELFFKNGFFHSDLHQGNFLVDVAPNQIRLMILDFGMGGTLSKAQRDYFLLLGVGAEINNPKMIAEALYGLSEDSRNEIDESTLLEIIKEKVRDLKQRNVVFTNERWIFWANHAGLRFASSIIGVSRGMTILDKLLKEAQVGKTVMDLSSDLAIKNKWKLISSLRSSESFGFLDYFLVGKRALMGSKPIDVTPLQIVKPSVRMCRQVMAH